MHTYISMLRGINVSGQKPIRMPVLKTLYESLGFPGVATYIQSGNVVFHSPAADPLPLVRSIEAAIKTSFGYDVTVIIRSSEEMGKVIRTCPFTSLGGIDPGRLYVTFLNAQPSPALVRDLRALPLRSSDEFVVAGREIYLHCPNGYDKTQLSNTFFEKHLDLPATTRNWKTVNTLHAMTLDGPLS